MNLVQCLKINKMKIFDMICSNKSEALLNRALLNLWNKRQDILSHKAPVVSNRIIKEIDLEQSFLL